MYRQSKEHRTILFKSLLNINLTGFIYNLILTFPTVFVFMTGLYLIRQTGHALPLRLLEIIFVSYLTILISNSSLKYGRDLAIYGSVVETALKLKSNENSILDSILDKILNTNNNFICNKEMILNKYWIAKKEFLKSIPNPIKMILFPIAFTELFEVMTTRNHNNTMLDDEFSFRSSFHKVYRQDEFKAFFICMELIALYFIPIWIIKKYTDPYNFDPVLTYSVCYTIFQYFLKVTFTTSYLLFQTEEPYLSKRVQKLAKK